MVATGNPHKVAEIREILADKGVRVLSLIDVGAGDLVEPDENGATFADNARIKATVYARAIRRMVLADDSGLAVDALDGAPGVFSARWSGLGRTRDERDQANNAKLIEQMASIPLMQRTARFVCAMCLAEADGSVVAETIGEFRGSIGYRAHGKNGFGYDSLFLIDASGRTSADLSPDEKNMLSHRGTATRLMSNILTQRLACS